MSAHTGPARLRHQVRLIECEGPGHIYPRLVAVTFKLPAVKCPACKLVCGKWHQQLAGIRFVAQPARKPIVRQYREHAIMDLRDQFVGRDGDDGERPHPFALDAPEAHVVGNVVFRCEPVAIEVGKRAAKRR
jgi:hypothetical protein